MGEGVLFGGFCCWGWGVEVGGMGARRGLWYCRIDCLARE